VSSKPGEVQNVFAQFQNKKDILRFFGRRFIPPTLLRAFSAFSAFSAVKKLEARENDPSACGAPS